MSTQKIHPYADIKIIVGLDDDEVQSQQRKHRKGLIDATLLDVLNRRKTTDPHCFWDYRWRFTWETYRVWTLLDESGVTHTYNGTFFDNFVYTNFDTFGEGFHANQGWIFHTLSDPFNPNRVITDFEPFSDTAFPLFGSCSFTLNRHTGVASLTTPLGTYTIPTSPNDPNYPLMWSGIANFRNFSISFALWKDFAYGGGNPTITFNASPYWVTYTNYFEIKRNNDEYTITGIDVIEDSTQTVRTIKGTYVPPVGSACIDGATESEAARASFQAELETRVTVRNVGHFEIV